jgi:hypothetical protein
MHAKPPAGIALIIESPELEHPDFSGPSFLAAKKQMLLTPDELPEPPELSSNGDMEAIHADLLSIADEIESGAADQANRLREICDKLYQTEEKASPNNGEAQELY